MQTMGKNLISNAHWIRMMSGDEDDEKTYEQVSGVVFIID